jgi:uncharacterized protein YjbI with pentapeptide repeats
VPNTSKILATVLQERTPEALLAAARRRGCISDGRIDLRDATVRFDHFDLDLSCFLFERTTVVKSRFTNCSASTVVFSSCRFTDVRFECKGAAKRSFRGADLSEASLTDCFFGPATLDLSNVSFAGARLQDVTFMFGWLAQTSSALPRGYHVTLGRSA